MAQVEMVTKEQLLQELKWGKELQVVDVLDPRGYEMGFVKKSLKIPFSELDQRIAELDRSREVVTYCAGCANNASKEAAWQLQAKGFKARVYEGGIIQTWEGIALSPERLRRAYDEFVLWLRGCGC